jgi:predicted transcriptional regulator of viral defense system
VKAAGATPAARGRRRTARGRRDEQLLALVRERPGITVAEAGNAMSVDPTGLYRVVSRLEERGEVRKNGRALEPTTAASRK